MTTKTILQLASSLAFAGAAFANPPATTAAVKEEAPAVAAKVTHKAAKEECLKENAGLKGKQLRECIKGKKHK